MNRLQKAFLKNYDPHEKELFLTARFVMIAISSVIFLAIATIIYTSYLHSFNIIIISAQIFNLIIMLVALGLLIKGKYNISVHLIFITVFTTIWAVLFLEPTDSMIIKMDTIVFVVGLMAAMPVISFKSRRPMAIYFFSNMILFLIFNYYLIEVANLTIKEHLDYFLDNLIVLSFVFLISFNIFTINRNALISLKNELNDRKKAEKALLESQYQLSTHLENTPVGVISWKPDFTVIDWNPSAESIFGYSRAEATGKHVTDLILPEDLIEKITDVFQNVLSDNGEGKRNVNENITKNGRRILCEWYNTLLKTIDGKIIGVASLVNDITERKKTQEMVIQSEKMMSVGGLAAGMAHEINNPLAGILQNAQVIRNRLTQDLPANDIAAGESGTSMAAIKNFMEKRNILHQLDNIHQAGLRVVKIIENMLSFSKKSDLVRREVDLAELIDNTLELVKNDYCLKKKCDFKTMEIIRDYSKDLPAIFCEKSKIQQVLFNLFKNASESMISKKYENETPKLTLCLKKDPGNIHIEVEDNGPGMNEETRRRVFEPFFTTKGLDKGTGLGLSISYFIIVDDHGGEMSVDSTPGKGARFTIKLPFRSQK